MSSIFLLALVEISNYSIDMKAVDIKLKSEYHTNLMMLKRMDDGCFYAMRKIDKARVGWIRFSEPLDSWYVRFDKHCGYSAVNLKQLLDELLSIINQFDNAVHSS